jgi:hypothetical protein
LSKISYPYATIYFTFRLVMLIANIPGFIIYLTFNSNSIKYNESHTALNNKII